MSLSSPGVHLFYHSRWQGTRVLDELCWGLEEQGVPLPGNLLRRS